MKLDGLKTEFLGRNVKYFESIDSTQKEVKTIKNPADGTLVIADNQVAGVGTHGRKWYTGNGQNIAMSFVLLPNCNIRNIDNITICIAKCLVNTLKKMYKINLDIKNPNDLYFKGKKVGGILVETTCSGESVKKICIGIGVNVNQDKFPEDLSKIATSLKIEFKKEFNKEEIIVQFLNNFEKEYKELIKK